MAPHSSSFAWKIPWTDEPGGLQSMGLWRVGHDWATSLSLFTFTHWRGNGNPLQCSCLENPRDGGACWAAVYGVAQSRTRLKRLSSSSSSVSAVKQIFLPMQETWVQCLGSAGEGNGTPLQYSCLGNPMDRGTWWATLHGVPESHTRLTTEHMHAWCACTHTHTHTHSWFTMLCYFQVYSKVIRLYIYIHTHFFTFFSIMVYHRVLNTVFCAI